MILQGHWIDQLKTLPDASVQCCVTSPPYLGLRSYLKSSDPLKSLELGAEKTPDEYVAKLVEGFREVRRVLKPDAVMFLNLGDSYAGSWGNYGGQNRGHGTQRTITTGSSAVNPAYDGLEQFRPAATNKLPGIKNKDLIGVPWMVAFALRADGWWLRQDIIWAKPNPMPESVTDRCTKSHEYIFLLSKSMKYYFDAAAIRNPPSAALVAQIEQGYNGHATKEFDGEGVQNASATKSRIIEGYRNKVDKVRGHTREHKGFTGKWDKLSREEQIALGSNKRSVWTVGTKPFKGSHFATFPPDLIRPCILAGSRQGDTVLDPFGGSGTVGQVCKEQGRESILIELNAEYLPLIQRRLATAALNFQPQELL